MFDAGSSGTRVYVYSWDCRQSQTMPYINLNEATPEQRVKPGISSYVNNLDGLTQSLTQLIEFAKQNVPPSMQKFSPIFLGATAGMRIISPEWQVKIIDHIRRMFQLSGFLFDNLQWARILTGQEEGAYLWLSVNYLLDSLKKETALTIDLGGASTQIAYQPSGTIQENELDIIIPNVNVYQIYSISHLYYGMDQALMKVHEQLKKDNIIISPCYHKGYDEIWQYDKSFRVQGLGDYEQCLALIKKYLNNDPEQCKYQGQCGINSIYQPTITNKIIYGVSGIQSIADLFHLTSFTANELLPYIIQFCGLTWQQIENVPEYISNPYIAVDYFQSIYTYELIYYGYRVPETTRIECPDTIDDISLSWTLASLFYQLAEVDCRLDSPICIQMISQQQ
ncbi:hypothetical protein pb186bvf_018670 [Paramecium bursaria]